MPTTLVLLPGMDGTGELFDPLLTAIGESMRTIVVRYPTSEHLDYPGLANLVRSALPVDEPFVILGESFSGPVAVLIAAEAPHGLIGLILCASFVSSPRPWLRSLSGTLGLTTMLYVARRFGARPLMGRFQTKALTERLLQVLAKVAPRVLVTRARAALTVDVSSMLAAIQVPALYLQALEDSVVSRSAAATFVRLARRGRVVQVAGPHFLLQCVPQQTAAIIKEFIRLCEGASRDASEQTRKG